MLHNSFPVGECVLPVLDPPKNGFKKVSYQAINIIGQLFYMGIQRILKLNHDVIRRDVNAWRKKKKKLCQ